MILHCVLLVILVLSHTGHCGVQEYVAEYWTRLENDKVQCNLCPVGCILKHNQRSFCKARINHKGTLYTQTYNYPCIINVEPIDKGPLYHVLPGAKAFTLSTAGCNLRCLYCQNWQISQKSPLETKNFYLTASDIVKKAKENNCSAIVFTYGEPVAYFEYVKDIAKISKKNNILTHICTAGFINEKPLEELCKYVDVFTVTLKSFSRTFYERICGQKLIPVLDTLQRIRKSGRWLEIVYLIVPGLNDDMAEIEKMCFWIKDKLGENTPVHFTRFYPEYKLLSVVQTPIKTLEQAHAVGLKSGLKYVYIENLPGHPANNTYCPKCRKEIIQRVGFQILSTKVKNGYCQYCGEKIPGIWRR